MSQLFTVSCICYVPTVTWFYNKARQQHKKNTIVKNPGISRNTWPAVSQTLCKTLCSHRVFVSCFWCPPILLATVRFMTNMPKSTMHFASLVFSKWTNWRCCKTLYQSAIVGTIYLFIHSFNHSFLYLLQSHTFPQTQPLKTALRSTFSRLVCPTSHGLKYRPGFRIFLEQQQVMLQ